MLRGRPYPGDIRPRDRLADPSAGPPQPDLVRRRDRGPRAGRHRGHRRRRHDRSVGRGHRRARAHAPVPSRQRSRGDGPHSRGRFLRHRRRDRRPGRDAGGSRVGPGGRGRVRTRALGLDSRRGRPDVRQVPPQRANRVCHQRRFEGVFLVVGERGDRGASVLLAAGVREGLQAADRRVHRVLFPGVLAQGRRGSGAVRDWHRGWRSRGFRFGRRAPWRRGPLGATRHAPRGQARREDHPRASRGRDAPRDHGRRALRRRTSAAGQRRVRG